MSIKLKDLYVESMYHSEPDGYGGYNEWNWFELKCKKTNNILKLRHSDKCIYSDEYEKFTGRPLTINELKKLRAQAPHIYNIVVKSRLEHHEVLVAAGIRTKELKAKIIAKHKLIQKHQNEYNTMLKEYCGGRIEWGDESLVLDKNFGV